MDSVMRVPRLTRVVIDRHRHRHRHTARAIERASERHRRRSACVPITREGELGRETLMTRGDDAAHARETNGTCDAHDANDARIN